MESGFGPLLFAVIACAAVLVALVLVPCLMALGVLAVKEYAQDIKRRALDAGPKDGW